MRKQAQKSSLACTPPLSSLTNALCPLAHARTAAPPAPPPPTDFAAGALAIETRFSQTQRLIDRLEKLVDRRALHNDPAAEIDEVSQMFSTDVTEVGDQIKLLVGWISRSTTKRSQRAGHCEQGLTIWEAYRIA